MSREVNRRRFLEIALGVGAIAALRPGDVFANHDGVVQNKKIGEVKPYDWFHPVSKDKKIWSYGVTLRDPFLSGASLVSGEYGELFLHGASDVGLDVKINTKFLNDYIGDGARAAIWLKTGKNDFIYLMNDKNEPVTVVAADDTGFAGILMPNANIEFGFRVQRKSGAAEPIKVSFSNLSKEDAQKDLQTGVIDVAKVLKVNEVELPKRQEAAPVEQKPKTVEFLSEPKLLKWENAEGKGFFRPLSVKGEGYTSFIQFSIPESPRKSGGTPVYSFKDKGEVGKFYALSRRAAQVRIDLKTFAPFVEHVKQGKIAPALWLGGLQPETRMLVHDIGGNVLAEARADGAGFGGIELPQYDAQLIITLNFPYPDSPSDVEFQMGPAEQVHLDKPSTVKLAGTDSSRLRRV